MMTPTARWEAAGPRVGLALSGGGARGLAHIGVLKVLEREGIPVDLLAGTSMGGVIAAVYAAGMDAETIETESLRVCNVRGLLSLVDPALPRSGFFQGQKIQEFLANHLGQSTFEDLRVPLVLIAVDLNSCQEVRLREGQVVDAVRATVSVPGVFQPVQQDGQLLVDGGLLNNLPADAVRDMGADVVIAVDVAATGHNISHLVRSPHGRRYLPNGLAETVEVLWRSAALMAAEINRRRLEESPPDVLIEPAIPPEVTLLTGFPHAAEAIASGERAAQEALPQIRKALDGCRAGGTDRVANSDDWA